MLLHGIGYNNFKIVNCDTLLDDTHFEDKKFTIQVANPPYSFKWNPPANLIEDERFSIYGKLAPKGQADLAFVQTMIHHMDSEGRIAVLLPHGTLFRGGAEETIRKYIVKNLNYLDAVIGLPPNCFNGTSIPVCCLVLKKDRKENSDNICFIDSSRYFTAGKTMNFITDEDIDRIVNAYAERKDIDKFCHIVTMEEIIENDYNLNIPRYVDTSEKEDEVDISQVKSDVTEIQSRKNAVISKIYSKMAEIGM